MPAPVNGFKRAILAREQQIGLWLALADPYCAEIAAGAGFDWLLIDGEHAPNDIPGILAQLQAVASYNVSAVVRLPSDEAWMVKQALDIGAQTLLIPMVESADQARRLVAATRYAPEGIRGIGTTLARASRFNTIGDYLATADNEVCLLVQVETRAGIEAIAEIAEVQGVDGIFVGQSDLAADMGFAGKAAEPEVQQVVVDALRDIRARGKAAGILSSVDAQITSYLELGAEFVAIGTDVGTLVGGLHSLRGRY